MAQRLQRRTGKPIARALIAKELTIIVYAMLYKVEAFHGKFCMSCIPAPMTFSCLFNV